MRHSQVWTEQLHSFRVPDESGDKSRREGKNLRLDAVVEEAHQAGDSFRGLDRCFVRPGDAVVDMPSVKRVSTSLVAAQGLLAVVSPELVHAV